MTKSSQFRLIFGSVLCLTLATGGVSLHLAADDGLNPHQERVFETSTTVCHVGMLTIFGLLGSKAVESRSKG
ncbi:MAG: hypothetical protein ACFB5Z_10870 [Elainellaceae cyanobacterium]